MDFLAWWQTLPSKMDPVLISIGPLTIYWYSTMYLVAFGVVYILCSKKIKQNKFNKINLEQFEDLLSWCFIGLLIGARFGYVIFYNFEYYFSNPLEIMKIWEGGMSFHGGLLGVCLATYIFTQKYNLSFFRYTDFVSLTAPIGIFLGRVANFINSELYGTITNLPWAVTFIQIDNQPRHPSQIYEALLEGLILF